MEDEFKSIQADVALVSIGLSCQSTHQIRFNAEFIKDVCQTTVAVPSGYFDWLICPPESATKFLDDGMPEFSANDITLKFQPTWERYKIYYWHEFQQNEIINIQRNFKQSQSKFNYLIQQFKKLRDFKRLIFVLSNTQNNLFEVREQTGSLDFKFDHQKVVDLKKAVENFLTREVEFLVVTNSDRFDGSAGHGYHIEFFKPDQSEWKGDKKAWKDCFQRYFT